jgi:hypothetical protein
MFDPSVLTTKEVMKIYHISVYTLRAWRRGWYTDSAGKHWFFPDNSHLEHIWNSEIRRFEYSPIKVAVWVHRMREKVSRVRSLAGSKPKKH